MKTNNKTLKLFTFILLLSIVGNAHSQNAAFELVEQNVLYRSYDNFVKVIHDDSAQFEYELVGTNVEISRKDESNYIVKTGYGKVAELFLIRKSEKTKDTIYTKGYRVAFAPDPSLYLGSNISGSSASITDEMLFAKYSSEIPLSGVHVIRKYKIIYGEKEFSGAGSNISEAKEFLESLPSNSTILIECEVIMPYKVVKRIYGVWKIKK